MKPRLYAPGSSWTLIPVGFKGDLDWREWVEQLLFLEDERIVYFISAGGRIVHDTGWTVNDLVAESFSVEHASSNAKGMRQH
jgi:hypothetical protein